MEPFGGFRVQVQQTATRRTFSIFVDDGTSLLYD